jgi:phenylacetate-CoA ligase
MTGIFTKEAFDRFAATLTRTERLPRPALEAYQQSLLKRLLSFAFENSPFYRDRLEVLFRSGGDPDLKYWTDVPVLTRRDLSEHLDRINPVHMTNEVGAITTRKTSGTTTSGLQFRTCDIARLAAEAMMHRLYRWHGFDLGSSLASIRYYSSGRRNYPQGITEPYWCFGHPAPHHTLDSRTPVQEMLRWLERNQPRYLLTFPSVAHDIAAALTADRAAGLGLKSIVGISELVSSDTAADVREATGCDIVQIYACAEMGCVALQSETDDEFGICEETVFVEILDADDRPVGPGETGRVILTSLYNYATPFIRYEIGDYATVSDRECPAGRTLQRLRRVTGRRRNALVARAGTRHWDDAVITPRFCRQIPTHIFQIRQPDLETIQIAFVADRANACPPDKAVLRDHFVELLGRPVELELIPLNEMPRSSGGKRERIVSNVVDPA